MNTFKKKYGYFRNYRNGFCLGAMGMVYELKKTVATLQKDIEELKKKQPFEKP